MNAFVCPFSLKEIAFAVVTPEIVAWYVNDVFVTVTGFMFGFETEICGGTQLTKFTEEVSVSFPHEFVTEIKNTLLPFIRETFASICPLLNVKGCDCPLNLKLIC